jgi:hypothetical protein
MATRHDREMQERRRRLRERQERERLEVRRRQQAQAAALKELEAAVGRLKDAEATVAAAVALAIETFPSVDELAEVTPFDARELRAYERRHRHRTRPRPRADQDPSVGNVSSVVAPREAHAPDAPAARPFGDAGE